MNLATNRIEQLKEKLSTPPKENIWEEIVVSGVPAEFIPLILENLPEHSFLYTDFYYAGLSNFVEYLYRYNRNDLNYNELIQTLASSGFKREERVSQKGEYSIRGDILTFWPTVYQYPIKIEFFGDEVENLEIFDSAINRRVKGIDYYIIPDESRLETLNQNLHLAFPEKPHTFKILNFDQFSKGSDIKFDFKQPRLFFQRFDLLEDYLKKYESENYKIEIQSRHQAAIPAQFHKYLNPEVVLPSGIISNESKYLIFTDRELLGSIFLKNEIGKNAKSSETRKILSEFEGEVEIGDFIVHEDHGIGVYKGITQEKASSEDETESNFLHIEYSDGDEILVPLDMLHKITKYIGLDGKKPELTNLGKGQWERLKKKTQLHIQIIAGELARHYAQIKLAKAKKIDDNESEFYKEFVNRFEFEETEDQLRAIQDVTVDLTSEKPMNRLIVGDVGFGKTEVILRAAFKVAEAGGQVAVLAPTTVLVSQHLKRFEERFKDLPFNIASLSRFSDKWTNKATVQKLKEGKIDIVIGTHRLLSNDVEFKNLELLVVDEEQKFGVKQKEKIKKLEYGVHVLSTTATPIPRTLSMALSSIQDISTIQTPPKGRKAVEVEVNKMDWGKIINAIRRELARGGQVFVIHNSVRTINSIEAKIRSLLPEAKTVVAHGQMTGSQIEDRMNAFLDQRFNVMVCTTILENGIDIKNVNTLIVLKAQNFGLSQLYQLKGRVGRSDRQAYSYFFYDGQDLKLSKEEEEKISPDDLKKMRDRTYIRRLEALSEAVELGAGFDIATKDLEIRGAGNLLGQEQSGNIEKIGYGLYMQMLAQEIERLKNQ